MASMRSVMSLDVNLGLFGFPVKVYKATDGGSDGVSFRLLHAKCGTPINMPKLCRCCNVELSTADMVKGFEVAPGEFVRVTQDELDALKPERAGVLKIAGYVEADSLDAAYANGAVWFLSPGGKDAAAFVTWRDALGKRAALGTVVMYGKEHVVAIQRRGKALILRQIRTEAEVRDVADVPGYEGIPAVASTEHLRLMEQVMDAAEIGFHDVKLAGDAYAEAVRALIASKQTGEPMAQVEEKPVATGDLMAALKASLAAVAA